VPSGWGAWIRTKIDGFKVRSAAIAPRPKITPGLPGDPYCNISRFRLAMGKIGLLD
jgi:hypothetical protein